MENDINVLPKAVVFAHQVANIRNKQNQEILSNIIVLLQKAVSEGTRTITYTGLIPLVVHTELKSKGYGVSPRHSHGGDAYFISF